MGLAVWFGLFYEICAKLGVGSTTASSWLPRVSPERDHFELESAAYVPQYHAHQWSACNVLHTTMVISRQRSIRQYDFTDQLRKSMFATMHEHLKTSMLFSM